MNPFNALRQIAIKHADHPLLFSSLAIGAISLFAASLLPSASGLPLSLFVVVVFVTAASLNTYRLVQQRLIDQQRQVQSLISLHHLLEFRAPLPALTGWAASPELLMQILIQIKRHQPKRLLELGSGASTIAIPYMLERWGGGTILSLDHDAGFAEYTRRSLELHDINDAILEVCPLVPQTIQGRTYRWYDLSNIRFNEPIDMVLVDGPPEKTNPMARFPALPLLWEHLADDALILMDDSDRAEEQQIIREWCATYPIRVLPSAASLKGFTVLQVTKTGNAV